MVKVFFCCPIVCLVRVLYRLFMSEAIKGVSGAKGSGENKVQWTFEIGQLWQYNINNYYISICHRSL